MHGVDSSKAMIGAAQKKAAEDAKLRNTCTFEGKSPSVPRSAKRNYHHADVTTTPVLDATSLITKTHLHYVRFNKCFSNAALHWILRPEDKREVFFKGVRNVLAPGGTFAFEMGGLGNISEIRAALLAAVGRRVGLKKAQEVDPWFFPDEEWVKQMMEETVGGWKIEKIEREWRPTNADVGGVEGWVRLMAAQFLQALGSEQEREEVVKEVVDVLEIVCAKPGGGWMYSYVRLRVLARKL